MLRAPATRGAHNKGCYFWTPLYKKPLKVFYHRCEKPLKVFRFFRKPLWVFHSVKNLLG
jgi:hypothetical protein